MDITQEYLLSRFHYSPRTGILTWLNGPRKKRRAGGVNDSGYRIINFYGRPYRAHRLIWLYMTGCWPQRDIDHRNGVRDDNAWDNLRSCTRSQNLMNASARGNCTTGYKGVSFYSSRNCYEAYINKDSKRTKLGYFETEVDAAKAYNIAAKEMFGEFAKLNII